MSSMRAIIIFLFIMWVMILLAGVIVIYVIGPYLSPDMETLMASLQ